VTAPTVAETLRVMASCVVITSAPPTAGVGATLKPTVLPVTVGLRHSAKPPRSKTEPAQVDSGISSTYRTAASWSRQTPQGFAL
jgi:hypothetical protein